MRAFRNLIVAVALFSSAPAFAQQGVPFFSQTIPSGTFVGRLSSGPGPTEAISTTAMLNALFPSNAAAFPFNAASVAYQGSVSQSVTVQAQAVAGNYTLQWPSTVGASNSCLVENVSGSVATLSFQACSLLAGNNTSSGNNTHNGTETFNGLSNFTSTFQKSGVTQNFPGSGNIVGTSDIQTLTNKSIDAGQLTGTISLARLPGSIDTNQTTSKTTNYTAVSTDCGAPLLLGGNAQFTLTVGAASTYSANCHLIVINTDSYSGVGTGRGKVMSISGITQHILYPGQQLDLRRSGSTWVPGQMLFGAQGQVWGFTGTPTFFVDAGAGSNSNDGLASGAGGAFSTLQYCLNQIYEALYDRSQTSTFCKVTAGTSITEGLTLFYPKPGAGVVQISSTVPGTQFTWNCPAAGLCLQTGDYSGVGLTDIAFVMNATSTGIIFGHQYGVIDFNTNIKMTGTSGAVPAITCDQDFHFNVNNGITYGGTFQVLFFGCAGSTWNINGAINAVNPTTLGRFAAAFQNSKMVFGGGVTFLTTGLTASAMNMQGNSVVNNGSGLAMPGGLPLTSTGAWYCGQGGTAAPGAINANFGGTISTAQC